MKTCCYFPVAFSAAAIFSGLAMALVTVPAMAAQNGAGRTVTISKADCSRLTRHVPSPDTAYRPGVDVHGTPVVPADLGGAPQIKLPEDINIAITVEIQDRFGIPATSSLFDPDAYIGNVTVKKDGSTYFNGQPLGGEEQRALAHLCQRQAKTR